MILSFVFPEPRGKLEYCLTIPHPMQPSRDSIDHATVLLPPRQKSENCSEWNIWDSHGGGAQGDEETIRYEGDSARVEGN